MKEKKTQKFLIVLASLSLLLAIMPIVGHADVPQTINYQGYLTDSGGTPLDTTVQIVFSIYNVDTGGTALWTQARIVPVSNGIYSVNLGEINPISLAFDEQYYLGVKVGTDAEMTPRQPLTSVGYSLRAKKADSVKDGAVTTIVIANDAVTTEKVASDAITEEKIATGAVTTAKIASGAVGSTQIIDSSIANVDLVDNSVTIEKISPNVISSIDGVSNDGGNIDLVEGSNITITPNDTNNTITIASTGGGGVTDHGQLTGLLDDDHPQYLNDSRGDSRYVNEGQANSISSSMVNFNYAGSTVKGGAATDLVCTNCVSQSELNFTPQRRVSGSCSSGSSIRVINADGTVTCETDTDTNTTYTAGTGLDLSGTEFSLEVPLFMSGSDSYHLLEVVNSGSGIAMFADSYNGLGVFGGGDTIGVHGVGTTSHGVLGQSYNSSAVCGQNLSNATLGTLASSTTGVYGAHSNLNFGHLGSVNYGVYGKHNGSANFGYLGGSSHGVYGEHNTSGNYGYISSSLYGVYGKSYADYGYGIEGRADGNPGIGVMAYATGSGSSSALYAAVGGSTYYAGSFQGNVEIIGNLTKTSGQFKIDHPLDPENKYLNHSFVESPDMKNIYDGIVKFDKKGEAWVELPDWFEVLNKDFRYQLTCIGGFSPVYVVEEISDNHFKIAGGIPGMKVSWQVTGIRQDSYANAHRMPVEEEKPPEERGYYLHPELYGQPKDKSIEWARHPEMRQRMKEARENQS